MPGSEGGRPDVAELDPGSLLDEALLRREGGHRPFGVEATRRLKPVGDVGAPLLAQGPGDGAGMLGRHRCETEFELDDSAHFLAPGVVPGQVDDAPVSADEAVDPVLVLAGVLDVDGPAIGLSGQAELPLEKGPPPQARAGVVLDAGIGVAVDVVNRLVGAAPEGQGDELAHLSDQVGRAKAPRGDGLHAVVFRFEQVAREGIPEAFAAHGAGDHVRLPRAFLGGVIVGDGGVTMDGPWSPGRPDMNARAAVKRAAVAASEP